MKKKSLIRVLTAAIAAAALLGSVTVQAAAVTDIDFEDPTYSTGDLDDQDGWEQTTGGDPSQVVDSSDTNFSSIFEGDQMAEVPHSGGDTRVERDMDGSFSDTFTFSVGLAYLFPSAGDDLGNMPRFSLQSTTTSDQVQFGLRVGEKFGWYDGGNLQGTADGSTSPDTFYVFSGEMRPSDGTWDLTITDPSDGSTLVNETDLAFKDWSGSGSSSFDQIEMSNIASGDTIIGMDSISVVPEPGTFALLALAGLLLMKRRRL